MFKMNGLREPIAKEDYREMLFPILDNSLYVEWF